MEMGGEWLDSVFLPWFPKEMRLQQSVFPPLLSSVAAKWFWPK